MKEFEECFGDRPDVIAAAPGRVNLLGEHTDYNDGYVLPTSIPQKTTVSLRVSSRSSSRVYSANLDEIAEFAQGQLPEPQFARYVYGCVEYLRQRVGNISALDIYIASEIPMGVGLSSSAALEVATLRALRKLLDLSLDDVLLAQIAQRVEIHYAGVNCGILDQMAASLLQPGSMLFLDTRTLERTLMPLPGATQILVIDSGVPRSLASSKYNERRAESEAAAQKLGLRSLRNAADLEMSERLPDPWRRRARHVITENWRVRHAVRASAEEFGRLMNASHESLRDDYEVSIPALDQLTALLQAEHDVYGAKLTGAGFGGACVALCRLGTAEQCAQRVLQHYRAAGYEGRVLVSGPA